VHESCIPDSVIIQRYGWLSPLTNISKTSGMVTVVINECVVVVVGAISDCRNSEDTNTDCNLKITIKYNHCGSTKLHVSSSW
jgi:hypothetical protein